MSSDTLPRPLIITMLPGPLFSDLDMGPRGEPVLRIPIKNSMSPLAGIGTTLVTGTSPLSHGIVTAQIPDETGQIRPVIASDRHFPAFWSGNGHIKTILIDWPAIQGDPDLLADDCMVPTRTDPLERLQESLDLMSSAIKRPWDVMAVAIHATGRPQIAAEASRIASSTLLALLEKAPQNTTLLVLHAPTKAHPDTSMTIIGGPQEPVDAPHAATLTAVGGMIRRLIQADCPRGVTFNQIPGISLPPIPRHSFPVQATTDETDWDLVISRVLTCDDPVAITLLVRRFNALAEFALRRRNWDLLLQHSSRLCQLRNEPIDHWQRMLSAERLNNIDALHEAIECAKTADPDHINAALGQAIVAVQTKTEDAKSRLSAIDLDRIPWPTAAGCYGRLCMQSGMTAEGMTALNRAVMSENTIAIDRLILAQAMIKDGNPESALQVMGTKGTPQDPLAWGIARLKAMHAMNHPNTSEWADSIRQAHPSSGPAIDSVMKAGPPESHD